MKRDIFVQCPGMGYKSLTMKKTLVVIFLFFSTLSSSAQNYKLHSLFIFSFTRYVQWPDAYNEGDFEIAVLGDTPLVDELKAMAQSKKVGDRSIKVTKVGSIADLKKCHILFLPAAKSGQIADVLAKISSQPVLVVTEENGMGAKGSIINFIIKDGKLAFELNQAAVSKQNLKVSNELSRLAILI